MCMDSLDGSLVGLSQRSRYNMVSMHGSHSSISVTKIDSLFFCIDYIEGDSHILSNYTVSNKKGKKKNLIES